MLPTFGLITEGVTDQIVLKNILIGHFNDYDLVVRPLQPALDATDASQMSNFGSWGNVFLYCESNYLMAAFEQNDFLIVQIDSDISGDKNFDVPQSRDEAIENYIERIKNRLITSIGRELYDLYAERLIFAIAVNAIECWLLPLYHTDKNKSATNNCIFKLNQKSDENDKIDPANKDTRVYKRISKPLMNAKKLQQAFPQNPSFKIFMADLIQKMPKSDP
jgi:hypothetical protein